ncbi:GntR family transcriptional regulator [Paractinoplanes brasiliensis]|uniref:GntR family transcriptional regulator n=1 Tax=Paractinoplanes brasiliensis TaxID=52695 RepID=A0A4R6JN59_9ACTN|nr:GntR family transcriptional regulator [Actinoplanes brasiliensis]TDO36811.1 GntR family transcriptional regulator [Actinoplanes brasiliensis]GID30327.1 GntR family transcriptional regulator [Actinoplanes brasiliensis]
MSTPAPDPVTRDVYGELRTAILRGEYAPRQRLIENELTERYATSRFVLRNVLTRLQTEGLIEIQPNRGARVREITVPEAIEITEIRRAIEGLVAARAAEQITDEEIICLRELGRSMQAAVRAADVLRYSELNAQLHGTVRSIARHNSATRIIEQLNGQMVRHQFRLSLVPGRPSVSLPEHLEIIEAVCSRDPDAAERSMRVHLDSVLDALKALAGTTPAAEPASHGEPTGRGPLP